MKVFRFLVVFILAAVLYSCGDDGKEIKVAGENNSNTSVNTDDVKKKELELKEKELQLKEKELELKQQGENPPSNNSSSQQQEVQRPPQQRQEQMPNNPPPNQRNRNNYSGVPGNYPEASTRYLSYDDCAYKSKYQLAIMRNEIYARYGYIFQKNQSMWEHFNSQTWYNPRYYNVDNMLTKIEKYNVNYIKSFE